MKHLEKFRKQLHAHPELGGKEFETQKLLVEKLKDVGIMSPTKVGGTGLLCSMTFGDGPHILIRVDIDALPIKEINTFEHRSKTDGVSHKCGHDGHATIGIGLAEKLIQEPLSKGSVDILFQPAEEIGLGAKAVINDPNFNVDAYDFCIAMHNIPGAPMHQVIYRNHGFTPAVQSLVLKLKGKTSHAAEPLNGINPAYAISEILQLAKTMEVVDEKHQDYALITPVYSTLGSIDYGISAGYGEVHFTIRSWKQDKMERVTEVFSGIANTVAKTYKLEIEADIVAVFAANQNETIVNQELVNAAKELELNYIEKPKPFPWGEDFGLFTQHIPGAMFGLGAGTTTPALHNPDYDYPDEITYTAINLFYHTAKNLITNHV